MVKLPTDTAPCEIDYTNNPEWIEAQMDRLIGFELLCRSLKAQYQPIEPERLADKIGIDKGISHRIANSIKEDINGL